MIRGQKLTAMDSCAATAHRIAEGLSRCGPQCGPACPGHPNHQLDTVIANLRQDRSVPILRPGVKLTAYKHTSVVTSSAIARGGMGLFNVTRERRLLEWC